MKLETKLELNQPEIEESSQDWINGMNNDVNEWLD